MTGKSPTSKSPSPAPKSLSSPLAAPDTASPSAQQPHPQSTAPLVADENLDDFDDADSTFTRDGVSDTASLRSSILKYREENGRTYHSYKDGSYILPNDDTENERLDLQHNIFIYTFDGKLHLAPLTKEPQRVLDAGCGTGIWAIEFADEHPESHVTGVDLSPIQPPFVPPNTTFYVDDVEDTWEYSSKFDFVFARFLTGSIKDWPKFFRQSFDNLNPGGVIEIQDLIYPLRCDDGTLSDESDLMKWSFMIQAGFASMGGCVDSALSYPRQLEEAGFIDVVEVVNKWPTNRWPQDKKHKQLGIWSHENFVDALGALSLAMFTRPTAEGGYGWSNTEVEVLLARVRNDLRNTNIHAYIPIHTVYAKKPE